MCYNAAYTIDKNLKQAIERETDPEHKRQLERMYEEWKKNKLPVLPKIEVENKVYYTNAFEHRPFPVIHNDQGSRTFGFYQWGLVPRWCTDGEKAKQIQNQTINARSESMFEKPSYRASALDRRCIVLMDGFFEYHHKGKERIPYFIQSANEPVMYVAGLWESAMVDGEEVRSFTIVTREGNDLMKEIHNNPKNPNRMPLILSPDQFDRWLDPIEKGDKLAVDHLKIDVLDPMPSDHLKAHTVAPLQGASGTGNTDKAQLEYNYDTPLEFDF